MLDTVAKPPVQAATPRNRDRDFMSNFSGPGFLLPTQHLTCYRRVVVRSTTRITPTKGKTGTWDPAHPPIGPGFSGSWACSPIFGTLTGLTLRLFGYLCRYWELGTDTGSDLPDWVLWDLQCEAGKGEDL